jgi:hypothetical protein
MIEHDVQVVDVHLAEGTQRKPYGHRFELHEYEAMISGHQWKDGLNIHLTEHFIQSF